MLAALHVRAALLAVSVVPAKLSTFPCVLFHLLFNPSTYLFRLLAFTSSTSSFPSPPPQSLLINFFLYSSFTSLPPISSFPLAFPPFISTSFYLHLPLFSTYPPPPPSPRFLRRGAAISLASPSETYTASLTGFGCKATPASRPCISLVLVP